MKSVVPIHNAVNERAWMEILKWEHGEGGESCGGPQLIRFQGDSKKISPKARFNMMFGYQKPFDRHDWMVDRCGTQVEYILDFYTGKSNPLMPDLPSFYIDVRPKFNTVEGCRLRLLSGWASRIKIYMRYMFVKKRWRLPSSFKSVSLSSIRLNTGFCCI